MPTRLQAFLAQQRSRGMSDQAIRRALGLSRQEAAEAELFGSKEAVGQPAARERKPSAGAGRRP